MTTSTGSNAIAATTISGLEQYTGATWANGTLTFSGIDPDGTDFVETGSAWVDLTMAVTSTTTLQNVLDYLNTNDGITVRDEVQTITVTGGAAGDTFTLSDGTYAEDVLSLCRCVR